MVEAPPPAPQAPRAISPSEIILYLDKDYRRCVRFCAELRAKYGPNPQHERELEIQKSVLNMFHYIYNDPEGFKEFAKRVRARYGEWPPKLPPQDGGAVYVLEAVDDLSEASE